MSRRAAPALVAMLWLAGSLGQAKAVVERTPAGAARPASSATTTSSSTGTPGTSTPAGSAPSRSATPAGAAPPASTTPAGAVPPTSTTPAGSASPTRTNPVLVPGQAGGSTRSAVARRRAHGRKISTEAIVGAALAALLVALCAIWAAVRWLAIEPRWTRSMAYSLEEASFRASATWAEFVDWARLGR